MPLSKKTAAKVSSQTNNFYLHSAKSGIKWAFKFLFLSYVGVTALSGFLVVLYISLGLTTKVFVLKDIPVDLGNGFIYAEHPGKENNTRLLIDEKGNVFVQGNVKRVAISGKTVYGHRELFWTHKDVYFICALGEDCRNTQNYGDIEFKAELQKRGLPPFKSPNVREFTNLVLLKERVKSFFLSFHHLFG